MVKRKYSSGTLDDLIDEQGDRARHEHSVMMEVLAVRIAHEADVQSISERELEKRSGVARSNIRRIFDFETPSSATLLTLTKLANAVGLSMEMKLKKTRKRRVPRISDSISA